MTSYIVHVHNVLCTGHIYLNALHIILTEWEDHICKFTDISGYPTKDPRSSLHNNIPSLHALSSYSLGISTSTSSTFLFLHYES